MILRLFSVTKNLENNGGFLERITKFQKVVSCFWLTIWMKEIYKVNPLSLPIPMGYRREVIYVHMYVLFEWTGTVVLTLADRLLRLKGRGSDFIPPSSLKKGFNEASSSRLSSLKGYAIMSLYYTYICIMFIHHLWRSHLWQLGQRNRFKKGR